jgi:hypothetical protein
VFERNRGGLYVRSKGVVTQDQSDPRDAALAAMTVCSSEFRLNCTEEQRLEWLRYASLNPDRDRWGRLAIRTAQQAFVSYNFYHALAYGNIDALDPPEKSPNPLAPLDLTIDPNAQTITLETPIAYWDPPRIYQRWYFFQGKPVYTTRKYFSGPYRFAGVAAPSTNGWPDHVTVNCTFPVELDQSSWVKIFYHDYQPRQAARLCTAKARTIQPE